ncbi:MAG: hypothetical protein JWR16_1376 [Nevskia sp.]|nr:hypothetical protein [Nevskia sp.]
MGDTAQLEKAVLSLPPAEREHLALAAWESLEADPALLADRAIDPDGVALALQRDAGIESGSAEPISHAEFLRRTSGGA